MSIMTGVSRKLRHNSVGWRYLYNFKATLKQGASPINVNGEASRVLEDLTRDGIAISHVDKLFAAGNVYGDLAKAVSGLEQEFHDRIESSRANAASADAIGQKTFIYFLLGDKPKLDPASVFARFALQDQILGIANAYMGMYSQLRYYNVWHTLANPGPARESQLWHRDRDDFLTCKVFLYLNDVDEGAGPFTYAKGTHPKGANPKEPPFTLEGTVKRSDDEQMAVAAPKDTWVKAVGRRGTIIFADTRGYHKGGEARTSDRIMYTCMFVSGASQVREMMTPPDKRVVLTDASPHSHALVRYS